VDYTKTGDLKAFSETPQFDPAKALAARDAAIAELKASGATLPVKVLMCYNPTTVGWAEECQVVEQQLEGLLGADYIDIIVQAGPSSGFLGEIRRSGKYAFMKCNWGLDFADPVNTAEPFRLTDNYCFLNKIEGYRDAEGNLEYYNLMNAARPIYSDLAARYEAFAKAEAWLIAHAITIPFGTDEGGYWASRRDPFEGQHNACGLASNRFKGQHKLDKPMSTDDFYNAYDAWVAAREALAK
jgi:oligopeptide transport system substrate-binding protein